MILVFAAASVFILLSVLCCSQRSSMIWDWRRTQSFFQPRSEHAVLSGNKRLCVDVCLDSSMFLMLQQLICIQLYCNVNTAIFFYVIIVFLKQFCICVFNSCFTFMYASRHQVKFFVRVNLVINNMICQQQLCWNKHDTCDFLNLNERNCNYFCTLLFIYLQCTVNIVKHFRYAVKC